MGCLECKEDKIFTFFNRTKKSFLFVTFELTLLTPQHEIFENAVIIVRTENRNIRSNFRF